MGGFMKNFLLQHYLQHYPGTTRTIDITCRNLGDIRFMSFSLTIYYVKYNPFMVSIDTNSHFLNNFHIFQVFCLFLCLILYFRKWISTHCKEFLHTVLEEDMTYIFVFIDYSVIYDT